MKETMMYEDQLKTRRLQKSESEAALKKLGLVSAMCITFMIIEFFGGYFSGSMAIMTDAAHLLSDFSGFLISMASVWIGTKEANRRLSFGFHRAEVIGALVSVILIWGLTLVLLIEAIDRMINPVEVDGKIMLYTACLGLIFNLIMVKILHGSDGHSHHKCSHNHSTEKDQITYEMEELGIDAIDFSGNPKDEESLHLKNHDSLECSEYLDSHPSKSFDFGTPKLDSNGKDLMNKSSINDCKSKNHEDNENNENKHHHNEETTHESNEHHHSHNHSYSHGHHSVSNNLNVRAAAIHIIGDIIQAIGVLMAAMVIYMFPTWQIVDPLCTILFSILVVFTTYFIVKDCMVILLEGVPMEIKHDDVKMAIEQIKGVVAVKSLHIWALTSGKF
jgi:zinc transporter 2